METTKIAATNTISAIALPLTLITDQNSVSSVGVPHQQLTVTGVTVAAKIKDWTRATPFHHTASPTPKPFPGLASIA